VTRSGEAGLAHDRVDPKPPKEGAGQDAHHNTGQCQQQGFHQQHQPQGPPLHAEGSQECRLPTAFDDRQAEGVTDAYQRDHHGHAQEGGGRDQQHVEHLFHDGR